MAVLQLDKISADVARRAVRLRQQSCLFSVCSCRSDSMTSLKSLSSALPRDISADRVSDRCCDRLTELPGNGRPALGGGNQLVENSYQPGMATPTRHLAGGSRRVPGGPSSIPYAVSAFCLRERDASHVSLQALSRGPAVAAAAAAPDSANLVRSRSVDHEFMSRAAAAGSRPSPPPSGTRSSRHDFALRPSVCPTQVGVLSKGNNRSSRFSALERLPSIDHCYGVLWCGTELPVQPPGLADSRSAVAAGRVESRVLRAARGTAADARPAARERTEREDVLEPGAEARASAAQG